MSPRTIFLYEISEIPLELQGKLLRVPQEKAYQRVVEDRTRRADVRIIAATNRGLKAEAAAVLGLKRTAAPEHE